MAEKAKLRWEDLSPAEQAAINAEVAAFQAKATLMSRFGREADPTTKELPVSVRLAMETTERANVAKAAAQARLNELKTQAVKTAATKTVEVVKAVVESPKVREVVTAVATQAAPQLEALAVEKLAKPETQAALSQAAREAVTRLATSPDATPAVKQSVETIFRAAARTLVKPQHHEFVLDSIITPVVSVVKESAWSAFKNKVSDTWNGVKGWVNENIIEPVKGAFNSAKSAWDRFTNSSPLRSGGAA